MVLPRCQRDFCVVRYFCLDRAECSRVQQSSPRRGLLPHSVLHVIVIGLSLEILVVVIVLVTKHVAVVRLFGLFVRGVPIDLLASCTAAIGDDVVGIYFLEVVFFGFYKKWRNQVSLGYFVRRSEKIIESS